MSEHKYFQFPVSLLRDLTVNKFAAIDKIIDCGLYRMASKNVPTPEAVARQLNYDLYHKKISGELDEYIAELIETNEFHYNLEYEDEGFDMFTHEGEISELQALFIDYDTFYQLAIEHYQIHAVFETRKVFGINIKDAARTYELGKELWEANAGKPFASFNADKCFEYRDEAKKEFDLIMFAAVAAVNSILGKKTSCKITRAFLLARMFGYAGTDDVPKRLPEDIAPMFWKWTTEKRIDRIIKNLWDKWYYVTYSYHTGGTYVTPLSRHKNKGEAREFLIEKAEMNKMKNKLKDIKDKENEIRTRFNQRINKVGIN